VASRLHQRARPGTREARGEGADHDRFVSREIVLGYVSFISSQAEFTPKQIQTFEERVTLLYRIKIEVANSEREPKLNMPVDAEIFTKSEAKKIRRKLV
jgi:hypothetical protein